MLKLPVKPPIVNENIDLSEYAKKSDVDAIGTSLGNKAEKKEVEKINSQLDTLTKKVDDEIKEIQSTTDTFKENINTSFNEFSNEQQNNFEALREEVLSDIEASYVGYDNEQHHNLESRLYSDFDKINQRFNNNSYLEYEGTSIKADNTYYGLTKDMVIKGRTLQNLVKTNAPRDIRIEKDNMIGCTSREVSIFNNSIIKPGSKYTIIFNVNELTCDFKIAIRERHDHADRQYITIAKAGESGVIRKTITVGNFIINDFFLFIEQQAFQNGEVASISDVILLEGDHTNTPIEELPFVEGIQGTGDTTKNLIDLNAIEGATGVTTKVEGDKVTFSGYGVNNKPQPKIPMKVKRNTNMVFSAKTEANENFFVKIVGATESRTLYENYGFTNNLTPRINTGENDSLYITLGKHSTEGVDVVVYDLQLEEGTTATPYEPYYDGYKISGKSYGKNLIEVDKIKDINSIHGTVQNNGDGSLTVTGKGTADKEVYLIADYSVKLEKGKTYLLGCKTDGTWGGSEGTDTVEVYLLKDKSASSGGVVGTVKPTTKFTCLKTGDYFIRFDINKGNMTHKFWDIHLEECEPSAIVPSHAIYEPYQESTYSYILDEPLMQLPNGVADSIDLETGVLTRRVGKVVLDGSENWAVSGVTSNDHIRFYCFIRKDENNPESHIKKTYGDIVCDKFSFVGNLHNGGYDRYCGDIECIYSDTSFAISIQKNKLTDLSVDGFKQWLFQNPTTVYFELAEPTTEQLEPTQLKSFEGTTHIISNNTLQATTSVKIHSYVQAVVTNLINENKALRSNVDILNVENEGLKETNEVQDELIDINMMATDEVYTMIEPLLASQPMSMERGMSKLVDMYVAMVQRGLKTTIDQVPIRYRAEVQAILEALEK